MKSITAMILAATAVATAGCASAPAQREPRPLVTYVLPTFPNEANAMKVDPATGVVYLVVEGREGAAQ